MNYTFLVTYNSVTTEVFPLNWLECSLVDKKEKNQIFYRRKFEGELTFGGKKLCPDFNLFYDLETTDPCGRIDLIIYLESDIYWEGHFSTSKGEWDLDNQTFSVIPLPTDNYSEWDYNGDVEINFLDTDIIPDVITTHVSTYTYTRNRWLMDVIQACADNVFGAGVNMESLFFTDTINYVTGLANKYKLLTIAQKSDIKRYTSSNPASVGNISFNELMDSIRVIFNVYWKYDGIKLRIEHLSYFDKDVGMDLRSLEISTRSNKYKYNRSEMPCQEVFEWMEAFNKDFIGISIKYEIATGVPSPCTDIHTISEYSVRFTTDIQMIWNDPDSVSDDGFVMFANYLDGGSYYVYFGTGVYTSDTKYNMDLSWGNLHNAFHRHGRVLAEGYLNDNLITFASIVRNKKQEINAIVCSANNTDIYEPNDLIITELGETYFDGERGEVERAVIHPYGEINFTLLYGKTNAGGQSEPPVKVFWLAEDVVLHNNSYLWVHLSEPAPYDMTFWIWIDETNCQEYVVDEGEMNHSELLDFDIGMEPLDTTMLKYNLDHSSLDGWQIKLSHTPDMSTDDTADLVRIDDLDCGDSGGTPPPPVAPDVSIDVKAEEYNPPGSGIPWYIENESGSISIGNTTLSITFKPQECTIPGSHLVYIRVKRNDVVDAYSTVYCKTTWQCNKNITVTAAESGDSYVVELSESSWT